MPLRIEDYALIGDCQTAALVGNDGSIDWLCLPRFDSGACFAALLGKPEHGRWIISPRAGVRRVSRKYCGDTLVLETTFETDEGSMKLVDFMPIRDREPDLVRIVKGISGKVAMRTELVLRFDYGSIVPWVRRADGGISAVAGPDCLRLTSPVQTHGENLTTVADFDVAAGDEISLVLTWYPSNEKPPPAIDVQKALDDTLGDWRQWSGKCRHQGPWRDTVLRSLITLKALTYAPTGGILAAATTSLPEWIGGTRNWDYRYCWVRDATFTLYALLTNGYTDEAAAWREWLLRAVAGNASQLNILYGLAGERRLNEVELDWLPGYENSRPVRVGNAAFKQFQLDVFGELIDALHLARRTGLEPNENAWRVERELLDFLESEWKRPDEGIWEVRGPQRHFTHSKVMAWVAFDRAVKAVERFGLEGPRDRWQAMRDQVHAEVCRRGYDARRNTFVQFYEGQPLDASLLMIPLVGFLPASDRRVHGTVDAIQRELMSDGFVRRYPTQPEVDGLPHGEGAFLPCTFWLADSLLMMGRRSEAEEIFNRLLGLCNDVGLLSEEYDPINERLLGNFPQAFSHVGLVNTACNLTRQGQPAEHRAG